MINRQYKCPICGAPVEGEKCEYCGCVIYDFANISTDEPRYIRVHIRDPRTGKNGVLQMKAIAVNPSMEIQSDDYIIEGRFGQKINFANSRTCSMMFELRVVEDNGKLFELIVDGD